MRCTPESLNTGPLSSPTLSARVASSNAFCICPGPNSPRSPPLRALLQWDSRCARVAKSTCPLTSCSRNACRQKCTTGRVCAYRGGGAGVGCSVHAMTATCLGRLKTIRGNKAADAPTDAHMTASRNKVLSKLSSHPGTMQSSLCFQHSKHTPQS